MKSKKEVRIVGGEGPKPCDTALFGEAPGINEHQQRRPFIGKSGMVLDIGLQMAGIPRRTVYVSNVYKSWPGRDRYGNDIAPSEAQVADHEVLLQAELKRVNPRFIGTVGRVATRVFLGDVNLEAVHGVPHMLDGRVIVPIVHPAAGMRPGNEQAAVWSFQDLQTLGAIVRGKLSPVRKKYTPPPSRWLAEPGRQGSAGPAVDTEGDTADPVCLSLAVSEHEGLVVDAKDAKHWTFVGKMVLHYALHDMPVLRAMGVNLDNVIPVDTMVKAYVLGEPQSLKDLTRRHLGYSMPEYMDVVKPYYLKELQRWVGLAVARKWKATPPELKRNKKGKLVIYQAQPLDKRLARLASDLASKDIDIVKRVKTLPVARIEKRVGPLMRTSRALRLLPRDEVAVYAGRDAVNTRIIDGILSEKLEAAGLTSVAEMDCAILPMLDRMQTNGIACDVQHLSTLADTAANTMESIEHEISKRWFGRRINLGSPMQVAELLYRKLRLRVVKRTKKGAASTDKKTLEILKDQHDCVTMIRRHRIAAKNHSFAETLPKFVGPDGRIHGTIKYTRVVSGRTSMEKPNMQQIPVRTEEGKEIRNSFVSAPGLLLGSWDYDQIEMKVMAHLSQDKRLCKFLCEGVDIHIKTASLIFGVKYDNVSKVQRTVTKNINYGLLFMIQEHGLYDQLRLVGIVEYDVDDCRRLIAEWFRIYPGVQDFREEAIAKARRLGCAKTMWGRPRWLPALYWPESLAHKRAEAERQAVSHEISGSAQDVIKRAMARLWSYCKKEVWPAGYKMEPLLQIHDELLWELEPSLSKWIGKPVCAIMNADSDKFRVPITASYAFGPRWGDLK